MVKPLLMLRICLPLLMLCASGCFFLEQTLKGTGNVQERPVDVPAFSRVKLEGPDINVTLVVGAQQVSLKGDENLLAQVKTEARDGTLFVTSQSKMEPRPELTIQVPALVYLEASSSSRLRGQVASSEPLQVVLSQGIALQLEGLDVPELRIKAESGIDIRLAGRAGKLAPQLAEGVNLSASNLKVESVELTVKKGVSASVYASQAVNGSITGGSTVRVAGSPPVREVSVSSDSELVFE